MRIVFCLLTILLLSPSLLANEIDQVKTAGDVNAFLKKTFPEFANSMLLDETSVPKTQYVKNNFYKLDLDGNGTTDLIVDSFHCIAVTSTREGKYDFHPIDQGGFLINLYALTGIKYLSKTPLLVIRRYD